MSLILSDSSLWDGIHLEEAKQRLTAIHQNQNLNHNIAELSLLLDDIAKIKRMQTRQKSFILTTLKQREHTL